MKKGSRLARKQTARNIRLALTYGFLSVILFLIILFFGLPLLIKIAVLLGSLRSSSLPVENKDILPPPPPVLSALPRAINKDQISLEGRAESGSTIEVFISGISTKKTVTDSQGTFKVENLPLTLGKNEIYTLAEDKTGNKSSASEKLIIWYDNEPPELEISQPAQEKTEWENQPVEILGKTDPEATIFINDHQIIVNQDGSFKYRLSLSPGENQLVIRAKDEADNETEKTFTLFYWP